MLGMQTASELHIAVRFSGFLSHSSPLTGAALFQIDQGEGVASAGSGLYGKKMSRKLPLQRFDK